MLEHEETTGSIIGAAIAVHRKLGPGFVESVYENALALELGARGVPFARQVQVPVRYDGVEVGRHRIDVLVEGSLVVELKTVSELADAHFAVVRSQLRAIGSTHGLLLNFARGKLEAKRVFAYPDASLARSTPG